MKLSNKSRHFAKIFVVGTNLLILTALLGVLELLSSLFTDRLPDSFDSNHRFNHTWEPGGSWTHREWIADNPDFPDPYKHVYNAQGWLEYYDIEKKKPLDTYRIFYLGDSFTEGTTPMAGSVPSLVETALNLFAGDQSNRIEVINTGTSSYSPLIYYVLTRYKIMDYDPDLLVVNIDMGDVWDDWKYAQTLILDEQGDPLAVPPRNIYSSDFVDTEFGSVEMNALRRVSLFLLSHSYTYNLILKLAAPEQETPPATPYWGWVQHQRDESTENNVAFTLDIVGKLAAYLKEQDVKLMLTSVPHYLQYNGSHDGTGAPAWSARPHQEIAALSERMGVPYLNSFEALSSFIQGTVKTEFYYHNDDHFNPRGYRIWANAHIDFILDRNNSLLPDSVYKK